jgi:hypothetical protein
LSADNASQPYIEQAARDKERAEKDKKDYDVSLTPLYMYAVSHLLQNKKTGDSGSGDGEEDDEE